MNNNLEILIPNPEWDSNLVNIILDLEKLRAKIRIEEVPLYIFFQLKDIFQTMETLGSARIEGNNTTLSEYIEDTILGYDIENEKHREIQNLHEAILFIENNTNESTKIDRFYISEIHKIITKDLTPPPSGEGSKNPGGFRKTNVKIKNSLLIPPDISAVPSHFDKFINFINKTRKEQYQLLMVAIAHHRFSYIHPFDNGNGRMGRLLNYALLIKLGFQVKNSRIINPSSVFYSDREKYYNMLSKADSLKDKDILTFSEYFLKGLKNEMEKIDSLMKGEYVRKKILIPMLNISFQSKIISLKEYQVLVYLVNKKDMLLKSTELTKFDITDSVKKSRFIKSLKDKKILEPTLKNGRKYKLNFINNYLIRGIISSLEKENFISDFLNKN